MKKLLVCLTLAAFAVMTSSQAGEQSTKDKAACTSEKASCSASTASTSKSSCCAAGKTAKTVKSNADVKGATLLVRK